MKKRILFITSFYSGLKTSILLNKWNPTGMPAIYKLIESLHQSEIDFDYCFIDKLTVGFREIPNDNFSKSEFYILGTLSQKPKNIIQRILNQYKTNKKTFTTVNNRLHLENYDLIYLDRANVGLNPFLRKIYKGKILLRLHGVGTLYQSFTSSLKFNILNYYNKIAFRSKFNYIISSIDGTPVNLFLQKYTNSKTSKKAILNGVDIQTQIPARKLNTIRFLFIGRLENDKGIKQILKAFQQISEDCQTKYELIIIGTGSLDSFVQNSVAANKNIFYHKGVSHKEIKDIYINSDVVFSLNFLGNISNVVLEAVNCENAIITLKKDSKHFFDIESNKFLGTNVIYIDRNDVVRDLTLKIEYLLNSKDVVINYQNKVKMYLKPKLISWDKRIEDELQIIKNLVSA